MRFLKNLGTAIFFGNYFYGICTVALCIEASLQQRYPLNDAAWYIFVFAASVLYYIYAYMGEASEKTTNRRTLWYIHNRRAMQVSSIILSVIATITIAFILYRYGANIAHIQAWQWLAIAIVPAVAILYYGLPVDGLSKYNLRRTGWLKPFVIGFVWAGATTIYPVIYHQLQTGQPYIFSVISLLLFIKNIMFIAVLGIMFDIKDYAADHNRRLKTFVVQVGLRKTLFYIILPLSLIGFISFELYALLFRFNWVRIFFNTIPFILLLIVGYSMHQRRSIMYYLVIIDGIILVKAICGILGMELGGINS